MDLIPKTEAQKIAEEINTMQGDLARYASAQLIEIYRKVNTDGQQQSILDVFGDKAVAALQAYSAFHAALQIALPSNSVPPPNLEIFQPQEDGTVLFVAPSEE